MKVILKRKGMKCMLNGGDFDCFPFEQTLPYLHKTATNDKNNNPGIVAFDNNNIGNIIKAICKINLVLYLQTK